MRLKDGAITHHSQANYPGVIGSHYRWQPEQYLLLFTTSSFATRQHNRVLAEVQERGIFGWQRFWSLAGYAPSLEIVENPQEPIPQAQFETHVQPEKTWIYTIAGTCLLASILIMLLSNALKPSKNKKKISEAAGASDMPSVNYKAGQPHIERGEVAASGKGEPGARLGSEADIPARTTECRVRLGVPLGEGRTREVPAIEREAVAEWVMGTMDSRPSSRAGSEAESTVHSSSVYTPSPSTVGARSPASSFTG